MGAAGSPRPSRFDSVEAFASHEIRLRPRAAMLHRIQQLGIDPGQPRQRLRIQPIVLLAALSNQSHFTRIRHDHFAPQIAEQGD